MEKGKLESESGRILGFPFFSVERLGWGYREREGDKFNR